MSIFDEEGKNKIINSKGHEYNICRCTWNVIETLNDELVLEITRKCSRSRRLNAILILLNIQPSLLLD